MGLLIGEVMGHQRRDALIADEMFTRLEEFVSPAVEPEAGLKPVVQVFDIHRVRNEQTRVILSDGIYSQEAILDPELVENGNVVVQNGSIVRLLKYSIFACSQHELVVKRIIKIHSLEVLVPNFRVVGEPCRLNWEEVKEDDWEEEDWTWLDPEEQEYEDPDELIDIMETSTQTITPGAVADINTDLNVGFQPIILQIVDIRLIANAQTERFRVVLSDGVHLLQGMLAPQLNDKIKNNMAIRGSIVFLLEYFCTSVQNRRIVIIFDLHVLKREAELVGEPKTFPSG